MQSPPNELGTSVREALPSDAQRIVSLAMQLGYDISVAHVERHLREIEPQRAVLVAVVPRIGVVGWIGISQAHTLTSTNRADVEGLVVEDEYRSNGIGKLLLTAAENWARRQGCTDIRVLSNIKRERAHLFYERLAYDILKTDYVFQKTL